MSTQIYGELTPLMEFLTQAIEQTFDDIAAGMIHLKIVKSDRSSYQPFDDFLFGQYATYAPQDIVLEVVGCPFGFN